MHLLIFVSLFVDKFTFWKQERRIVSLANEERMLGGGGGEQLQGGKVVKTLDSRARCPSLNHFFLSKENKEYTTRQHKDYSREL